MDDAWETNRYIHPRTHEMQETQCARVYHINVVLHLLESDGERSTHRVRAVVNRKGILRIEAIRPDTSDRQFAVADTAESANIQIFDE